MADNGGTHRRAGRRGLWIVAGIAAVGAVCAVVGIWHLPARMYPDAGDADARAALQSGLLTAAAALTAVAGGLIALDETRQANAQVRWADENTHVRELYATAISQLSADTIDSRLGGIYALERVAVDSPADQRTVVEVLSAFVREHTRPQPAPAPQARRPPPGRRWDRPSTRTSGDVPDRPGTDVQAALTVLGRLPVRAGVPRADLVGATLSGARLNGATLTSARLNGATLTDASLAEADLSGAWLAEADLTGAWLDTSNLTGAWLNGAILKGTQLSGAILAEAHMDGADLTDAWLLGADLTGATLSGANFTGTQLGSANLTGARLDGAVLTGTNLNGAILADTRLDGADFTGAQLGTADLTDAEMDGVILAGAQMDAAKLTGARRLSQEQVNSALGSWQTMLPPNLIRPASWGPRNPPAG